MIKHVLKKLCEECNSAVVSINTKLSICIIIIIRKYIHYYLLILTTIIRSILGNAPHLSRVIPARSWAGAVPTLLTHESLDLLCKPCLHPQKDIPGPELSPLERFLGCVSMRRNLQRFIQAEETVRLINFHSSLSVKFEICLENI